LDYSLNYTHIYQSDNAGNIDLTQELRRGRYAAELCVGNDDHPLWFMATDAAVLELLGSLGRRGSRDSGSKGKENGKENLEGADNAGNRINV
jgi:hypothetical protein